MSSRARTSLQALGGTVSNSLSIRRVSSLSPRT